MAIQGKKWHVATLQPTVIRHFGRFHTTAGGVVDTQFGRDFVAVRTGVGLYSVTFPRLVGGVQMLSCVVRITSGGIAAQRLVGQLAFDESLSVLTLATAAVGSPNTPLDTTNNFVTFNLAFLNQPS